MKHFVFIITFILTFGLTFATAPKREMRAVWLTVNYNLDWPLRQSKTAADIEFQKKELCKTLDRLKSANINTVFFQTRIRGTVVYKSDIEPFSEEIKTRSLNSGFDALQFAIEECHRRGMELHAWFSVYPLGKKKENVSTKLSKSGCIVKWGSSYYINPGHPKSTPYLTGVIEEMVEKYDIDGLHFDYIRYPDKSMNFPDTEEYKKYGKKRGLSVAEWRRENINHFVSKSYEAVKRLKPWVAVSSSVAGMYDCLPDSDCRHWTAMNDVFQDPVEWIRSGNHDFIVPMLYVSNRLFFPFVEDWKKRCGADRVMPGIGVYLMDEAGWKADVIASQIDFERECGLGGCAFFRARNLTENKEGIFNLIETEYYSCPALPPVLPSKDGILPALAGEVEAREDDGFLVLTWPKLKNESEISYNLYRSATTPVDTDNPSNLVAVKLETSGCKIKIDTSSESVYYYTVTAFDRFRRESAPCGEAIFVEVPYEK